MSLFARKQLAWTYALCEVFIARIGSSLYFANASFVKDMLLAHVNDLEEVNKTQYVVLEMTPVISIDATAVHVIKDVVNDFRMRGLQAPDTCFEGMGSVHGHWPPVGPHFFSASLLLLGASGLGTQQVDIELAPLRF